MPLTKYQRGDTIEGWNDCPLPLARSGAPKKRVLGRLLYDSSRESSTVDLSSETSSILTPTSKTSSSVELTSTPPTPAPVSKQVPTQPETQPQSATSVVDVETVKSKLDDVLSVPSQLPERELLFYKNKVLGHIDGLSRDHLQFLYHTLENVGDANLKKDVVQYMIANDGVSGWCSPLKKLLENLSSS